MLLLKVKINIVLDDAFAVYAKVLFIKIKLFPPSKKKKKAKPKKVKKEKKAKEKKKSDVTNAQEKVQVKLTIFDYIKIITDVVNVFFKKFAKHLHIKLAKIYIKVATDDAAQTAILYGAVSQSLAYLVEALDSVTNLDGLKSSYFNVEPDYLSNKFEAKINITFSIRIIGILDMGLKSLFRFLKLYQRAKAIRAAKMQSETTEETKINNENTINNRKD